MARARIPDDVWARFEDVYRQGGTRPVVEGLRDLGYEIGSGGVHSHFARRGVKHEPAAEPVVPIGVTRRCRNRDCIERFVPVNKSHWYHEPACAKSENLWSVEDILREEGGLTPNTNSLEIAKAAFGQKNRAVRENQRLHALRTYLAFEVRDAVEQNPTVPFIFPKEVRTPDAVPTRKGNDERAIVLVNSDHQVGKIANGIGVEHYEQVRVPRVIEATQQWIRQLREGHRVVNEAHVVFAGDMIEGCWIYRGQNVTGLDRTGNTHRLTQQIRKASEVEARIVQSVAGAVPQVYVHSVPGNHGRPNGRNDFADPEDNFDTLVADFAQVRLGEHENITWNISDHWWTGFEVFGRYVVVMHGDKWTGALHKLEGNLAQWIQGGMFPRRPDVVIVGHRHYFDVVEMNGVLVVQNGTIDGGSPWYTQAYGRSARPMQTLLVMSRAHGVEGIHPIYFPEQQQPAAHDPLERNNG